MKLFPSSFIFITSFVVCLASGSVFAAGAASAPTKAEKGDAQAGQSKVQVCAACHGADGNSSAPSNPKLAGQGERYLFKQLKDIQSGEREIALMSGLLNGMSDSDLLNIAAFYASQTQALGAADPDLVALGKEIYRNGNHERGISACAGCHGPAGEGNAPGGFPRLAGQHADYIASQLRGFAEGLRVNDGESRAMRGVAERMNENEIKAVASYIEGLR